MTGRELALESLGHVADDLAGREPSLARIVRLALAILSDPANVVTELGGGVAPRQEPTTKARNNPTQTLAKVAAEDPQAAAPTTEPAHAPLTPSGAEEARLNRSQARAMVGKVPSLRIVSTKVYLTAVKGRAAAQTYREIASSAGVPPSSFGILSRYIEEHARIFRNYSESDRLVFMSELAAALDLRRKEAV